MIHKEEVQIVLKGAEIHLLMNIMMNKIKIQDMNYWVKMMNYQMMIVSLNILISKFLI